jgi:hypothetical protein
MHLSLVCVSPIPLPLSCRSTVNSSLWSCYYYSVSYRPSVFCTFGGSLQEQGQLNNWTVGWKTEELRFWVALRIEIRLPRRARDLCTFNVSRFALGSIKNSSQLGVLSPRKKRGEGEHEGDHSLPFSTEFKNAWSYISTHTYAFMVCRGMNVPWPSISHWIPKYSYICNIYSIHLYRAEK